MVTASFRFRLQAEERELLLAFSETSPDYMRRTRRVIPFVI